MAMTFSSSLALPLAPAKTLAEIVASETSGMCMNEDLEVKSTTAGSTRAPSPARSSTTIGAAPLEDVESAAASDVDSDSDDEDATAFIQSVRKYVLKNTQPHHPSTTARVGPVLLQAMQHNADADSDSEDEEAAMAFRASVRRWMARPGATQTC
mmetsp:Transcript_7076/g.17098  ORF Transcript_7076/g.17098 Transcript_7076/m.17098 type:complete len:154 (-) Transcript_7076:137-598(-)